MPLIILSRQCCLKAGGWKVEADWPADRGLDTFKKGFDVEFHSEILDLVDGPLTDEG
jgi:hypothetical protein